MRNNAFLMALIGLLWMMAGLASANPLTQGYVIPEMSYLRIAPTQSFDLETAMASSGWQPVTNSSVNEGYIDDVVWLRFKVPDSDVERRILEIRYAQLDEITFYLLKNGELTERYITGDHFPFSQRPVLYRNFLFPFSTKPTDDSEIYLKVKTQGSMQIPLRVWTPSGFFEHTTVENQLHSVYYGILMSVIFFNLFVFLALRERMYLLYVLSTSGYLLLLSSLNGTAYRVLWPDLPALQNQIMVMTAPLLIVFTLLFSRDFLRLKATSPRMDMMVKVTVALNAIAILLTFVLDYGLSSQLSVALAIPSCLLLTVIGPIQWIRGNPQASYYTIAWGLLTLGSAIAAANKYGLIPNNFITAYGMQIGSAMEAILLTIALAARLYQEREEKVHAREAEIAAMAARRSAELRLIEHALHNPLTGLPNRTSLEIAINELITRHPDTRYSIGVINLQNLQAITKTLGHRNTDRLIELSAKRYNSIVKELPGICPLETSGPQTFYLASLESQIFAFVVETDIIEQAPQKLTRAIDEIREPLDYLGMRLPTDPRVGIAVYPEHAVDTNSLIRRAFIAQGSEDARDYGIAYYQLARDSFNADRLTLVTELKHALASDGLTLHLQPKMSLKTRQVVGLEALIRWPRNEKPVYPDEIIAIAEQTGLIKPLTRWVLETALNMRSELLEQGIATTIAVNISPNNLREPDFPIFVQRLMSSYPQHRGGVILEVTETSMMQDPVNSLKALNQLHKTGIPLAIDDFGSGYSSLSYIKQLPANEIKIDRSLISDLLRESNDRVIVQTTIQMCQSLGFKVVAEGVEDGETAELLTDMGCDMVQGFYLTKALPLSDAIRWVQAHSSEMEAGRG